SGATPRERDARRLRYQTSPRRAVSKAEGELPALQVAQKNVDRARCARRREACFAQRLREVRRCDRLIIGTDQDTGNGSLDIGRLSNKKQSCQLLKICWI